MRRVLYLWVPHLQTTLERQGDSSLCERPLLVVERQGRNGETAKRRNGETARRRSAVGGRRSAAAGVLRVLDASAEAVAEGVTIGMTARMAGRRCPEAVLLVRERACYEAVAVAIGHCLAEQTPWVERVEGAQDEFFADLGAGEATEGVEIAQRLGERVTAEFGLEPRLVLATSRFVARAVGRELTSPPGPLPETGRGSRRDDAIHFPPPRFGEGGQGGEVNSPIQHCLLVPEGVERRWLRGLEIEALWEARPEVRRRMQVLGLRTLGQLAAVPQRWLVELFGPAGRWYGLLARGVDPRRVRAWDPAPSITATCTLPDTAVEDSQLEAYLRRLATHIARDLVREGRYARTVTVILTLEGGRRLFASRSLKEPTNLARTLARVGFALLGEMNSGKPPNNGGSHRVAGARSGQRFRRNSPHYWGAGGAEPVCSQTSPTVSILGEGGKLALSVADLESYGALQLSIFGDVDRGPALRAVIARIQERFGETAIGSAGSYHGSTD